jgi:hypothetical protein
MSEHGRHWNVMKRSRAEILAALAANRDSIRAFGARRLGLFGSSARDEARPESDLDFVVQFDSKTFDAYMGLKGFLEELFGCRVDLVVEEAIKPRLKETILREAIHAPGL